MAGFQGKGEKGEVGGLLERKGGPIEVIKIVMCEWEVCLDPPQPD